MAVFEAGKERKKSEREREREREREERERERKEVPVLSFPVAVLTACPSTRNDKIKHYVKLIVLPPIGLIEASALNSEKLNCVTLTFLYRKWEIQKTEEKEANYYSTRLN